MRQSLQNSTQLTETDYADVMELAKISRITATFLALEKEVVKESTRLPLSLTFNHEVIEGYLEIGRAHV